MGHIHLGVLPRTKKWREVVDLLAAGFPDEQVVAASAIASERDFANAVHDPVFVEAVRLLALIPQAARSDDFDDGLRAGSVSMFPTRRFLPTSWSLRAVASIA